MAPTPVDEEAIDALGVVTESQLEKEYKAKKRQYLIRGICCFVFLLLVIVIPVAVVQSNKSGGTIGVDVTEAPSQAPSMAPTSTTYTELLSAIEDLYGDGNDELFAESFANTESPQSQAAKWAADVAPIGLSGQDPRMISRYALATLYFATNGDDWKRCGRDSTECDLSREWLTAENECDW